MAGMAVESHCYVRQPEGWRRDPKYNTDLYNACGAAFWLTLARKLPIATQEDRAEANPQVKAEVEAWIDLFTLQTKHHVVNYWPHIEAVARTLIEHRTLTYREVLKVVRSVSAKGDPDVTAA
jgi:hypothetical protein